MWSTSLIFAVFTLCAAVVVATSPEKPYHIYDSESVGLTRPGLNLARPVLQVGGDVQITNLPDVPLTRPVSWLAKPVLENDGSAVNVVDGPLTRPIMPLARPVGPDGISTDDLVPFDTNAVQICPTGPLTRPVNLLRPVRPRPRPRPDILTRPQISQPKIDAVNVVDGPLTRPIMPLARPVGQSGISTDDLVLPGTNSVHINPPGILSPGAIGPRPRPRPRPANNNVNIVNGPLTRPIMPLARPVGSDGISTDDLVPFDINAVQISPPGPGSPYFAVCQPGPGPLTRPLKPISTDDIQISEPRVI